MRSVHTPHTPVRTSSRVVRVSPAGKPPFDVAYERRGSGEPLVLLHGIGHHWQAWEPVLTALSASYDVIALDLPGFGASPPLPAGVPYGLETMVPLLADVCAALDVERPHVAGNSLGGLLALEMGRYGYARSVTALSPGGFWNAPERLWAVGLLRGMRAGARGIPDGALRRVAETPAGRWMLTNTIYTRPGHRSPDAVVAETRALRDATAFEQVLASEQRPRPGASRAITGIPVTVAWGDRDLILLRRQGVRAKRAIPAARLVRLRGCGHVPMNDDPATVTRVVVDTARAASA
ncbi:alpha/beta fold hydrolase [Streptomyces sp. NPDC048172]|uniref:alpha/beta fold hydrolase n=1 Tax=Streptomyces sp. NPDC048172 TaxID=3365505 RepID=UPI003711037D